MLPRGMPSRSWAAMKTSFQSRALDVRLELRQIEIWTRSALQLLACVVEEGKAEVEETGRDGGAVDEQMRLCEMPAARPDQERGDLRVEGVCLLIGLEGEPTTDGLANGPLPGHDVVPGGGQRVLEIRHEDASARVEGVDHHLPLDRPGDLHPPVLQVRRSGRDTPRSGRRARALSPAGSPAARRRRTGSGARLGPRAARVGAVRRTDGAARRNPGHRQSPPRSGRRPCHAP